MPQVASFLRELGDTVERGSGEAILRAESDELSLVFRGSWNEPLVLCAMNDKREGKENSVQVKFAIEPAYYAELKRDLAEAKILAPHR
jgi:hypothetical protein